MHLRCKQAIPIYQKWYEHKTSSNAVYLSLNVNAFWHICSRGSWMGGKLCKFSNFTLFQNWTASCYQRRNTRKTTSNWNLSFLQTHFKNIVIKEEIANNEQFIHLPQCLSICPITDRLGWCSGIVCASDVGGRGFDPRLRVIPKTWKMVVMTDRLGAHGCGGCDYDWLAGVRINVP